MADFQTPEFREYPAVPNKLIKDATAHLSAMNALGPLPWALTFSYGRALQAAPQKAWSGKADNVGKAQAAFAHRARMNGLAATGQWKPGLEKQAA